MGDSLRAPWILDYLISNAEQYGGNLSAVPRTEKPSKAQLVKFLTFAPADSTAPCVIWADVSDKKHYIHARLSVDAIERYMQHPSHAGVSITSHKSACVRLRKVRLAFGRVARRDNAGGMTSERRLYLDVDEIDLLGAFGETTWGAPVDIAQDPNIREWMIGLGQDGGGGNVLKLRKESLLAQSAERAHQLQADSTNALHQTTINAMDIKVRVARKSAAHKPRPSIDAVGQRPIASKEAVRRASWKRLHTNMMKYFRPPDDVYEQLMLLCGHPREPTSKPDDKPESPRSHRQKARSRSRSRSVASLDGQHSARSSASPNRLPKSPTHPGSPARTPSHWSPSVRGSPGPSEKHSNKISGTEDESEDDLFKEDSDEAMDEVPPIYSRSPSAEVEMDVDPPAAQPAPAPECSMPMPAPAQPRIQPPPSSLLSIPYASSPPAHSTPKGVSANIYTLPPSSFPPSSYRLPPSPTSSPRLIPMTPAYPVPAVRRVPLPQYSLLRRDPDASGEGRVLVENSDTASPGSHRPSQTQSQSQSQGGSHSTGHSDGDRSQSQGQFPSQSQSQSQRPSQLRNEVAPAAEGERDPGSGAVEGVGEDDVVNAAAEEPSADASESQESQGQPQRRSQQSLSYKGDSQSQEAAAAAPVPDPAIEQPVKDVAPSETRALADDEPPVVADGSSEELREAGDPVQDNTTPGQRSLSPMTVDPAPSAPGWAAITAASASDSEDSQTEVDELLSDPLLMADPDTQPPRRRAPHPKPTKATARKTAQKERAEEGRMEADDARTAAMIEEYTAKVQKVIDARKRSADTAGTSPNPQVAEPSTGEPASKRRRTVSNEVESEAGPNGPSQPLSHDPVIWAAPAFMRKAKAPEAATPTKTRPPEKVKVKVESASPPKSFAAPRDPAPQARKRAARPSSPSLDREQSPAKKRKTSTAAVPVSVPALSGSRLNTFTNTTPPDAPLPRNVSRAPSSRPSARASSTLPQPQPQPQPQARPVVGSTSAGSSREAKTVDLRAASRSASRTSSRASRVPEEGGSRGATDVSHIARPVAGRLSSSAKGKSVTRESNSADVSSRPAVSQDLPSTSLPKTNQTSGSRAAGPSSKAVRKSHRGSAAPAESSRLGEQARPPLLGGFSVSLEPTRTAGGPPLLGWDELLEILLKTGKARYHREQQKESGG
ncbi:hypothetical protein VTO73DRAFT_2004 [Trametes versicolor]